MVCWPPTQLLVTRRSTVNRHLIKITPKVGPKGGESCIWLPSLYLGIPHTLQRPELFPGRLGPHLDLGPPPAEVNSLLLGFPGLKSKSLKGSTRTTQTPIQLHYFKGNLLVCAHGTYTVSGLDSSKQKSAARGRRAG